MPQTIKQIKVFISCPSDVENEKSIVESACETLSSHIFARKNIQIRTIHWAKDTPRIITGEGPQKIIDRYVDQEDYDIYIGILWGRFGEPQEGGLTPTESEFENALKRYKEMGRPVIKFFFKKEKLSFDNGYDVSQLLAIQRFKKRIESPGLYDEFNSDLEFQKKVLIGIQQIVEQLTIEKDSQISFRRIKYPEVISYISRKVYPADKYKLDEFWFLGDKYKEDIINIIKVKNRIALIGDAGSGKTFELERIANHFSEKNAPFYPLLIRLNIFTTQGIEEILPANWERIPENQLLIILDGLDEIESKNKKDAIRKIEHFAERHPSSTIIISCRTNFYQTESEQASGTLSGFESYRLLDLESEQIKGYVEGKLFLRASRFSNEISRNRLDPLVHIPFYLVKLVELFEDESGLPQRKAMIFERLVMARMKLDEDHFRTMIDLNEYRDTIIKNLERVALGMECLGRNYLFDDEYRELVPDVSSRDLIKHCTAWKKETAERVKWQFEHNSIQEYLAARVLCRQPLSVIKDFVSFKPEYKKIIPSWVNTVSFLISISEDSNLINWVLEIEPEICLKFEPDKISRQTRIRIFKDIFDRYKEKKIWIDRERFRNDELAQFGQSDEVIDYLLNEAENAGHPTTLRNAIKILSEMLIPPDFKDRTKDLLEKVGTNDFNIEVKDSIQSTALIALSHLKFDSKDVLERIVSELRSSTSEWVRYGLYYVIHNSEFLDDFIDVFLEGIPYASMDFSTGRLANERLELKQGLKKVKSPHSVIKIMRYFIDNEREVHDLFLGDHDISFLAEIAAKAFLKDSALLEHAIDFSLSMLSNHQNKEAGQFLLFYERTNTKLDAFKKVLSKKSQHKEELLADLADEQCLGLLNDEYVTGRISDDEMWGFLHSLRWKNKELFDPFYKKINQEFDNKFELKPVPDWEKIRKERRERDIHLIFNKESLLKEIKFIFETENKEVLTPEELSELRSKYWLDQYYSDLAYETLRKIAGNQNVTFEKVIEALNRWDWNWFCISEIYEKMRMHEEFELSQEYKKWIAEWCYSHLNKVDFKTAIQKTDESISTRWDAIFVWYFFRKFDLRYHKNILLDMLSFDHETTGIEYLERCLDAREMTLRILENLHEGIIIDDVLKNHIEYCKRHKVREVIKYVLKEIANQDRDPNGEIRRISLEAVCELSEGLSELEETLPEVKDEFKWRVIDELVRRNSQKVRPFLKELFEKADDEERIRTSEYLIRYQDLNALRFYVDWIKRQDKFSRQLFDSSPLTSLKTSDAIPFLIELLKLNYQEDFEQPNRFERLDRLVLDSLTMIALESDESYLEVKKSVETFIESYSSIYQNVNWLNAFLDQLAQKYYINKSEQYEIEDVIRKLEKIGF